MYGIVLNTLTWWRAKQGVVIDGDTGTERMYNFCVSREPSYAAETVPSGRLTRCRVQSQSYSPLVQILSAA